MAPKYAAFQARLADCNCFATIWRVILALKSLEIVVVSVQFNI